jgi:hypothetical protein
MAVPPYVTAGTTIEESWGDQIADAVVNPFASSAARSAAITAPTNGMTSTITAASALNGFEVYNGVSWAKPWSLPWGVMGDDKITSPAAASSAKADTGLTITTGEIPANRILKHTVTGMVFFGSINDMCRISIVTGSSGGTDLMEADFSPFGTANAYTVSFSFYETTASTAALTRRITQERIVGTSSTVQFFCDSTRPATYIIEDIGPSGAPA